VGTGREDAIPVALPEVVQRYMVDSRLLEILVCPENREPLSLAGPELLKKVNDAVAAGTLLNRGGKTVRDPISEGLVRKDGAVLYPVRDDIPVMLLDEAIPLEDLN
jgi:uncharacterized protein YbaR (Trm112 family)